MHKRSYRAMVSSDWSECLSPNGPFDPLAFTYPELADELSTIFREYTGNRITLRAAVGRIRELAKAGLTEEQMDAYLVAGFKSYTRVSELIQWCLDHDILFMINTTGSQGYFQRAIAKGLLPEVPFIAANPVIRFPTVDGGERYAHEVLEIDDKPKNTEAVAQRHNISFDRIVIVGDSGGDGPHFAWGGSVGAHLVGSMTKTSLSRYCEERGITIRTRFGVTYAPGEPRNEAAEMKVDFKDLIAVIREVLRL